MNAPTQPRGSWQTELNDAVEEFQHWRWRDTLQMLRERFREDRLGVTASSLTFTTLISLVPLVAVMLAIFTAFPIFAKFQEAVQRYFLQTLVPDTIAKPVLQALTQFALQANRLGTVGLLLLGVSAVMLMLTIDRTLNEIWRVRKPRSITQRVLVYWAGVTLGPLLLGASLWMTSYAVSASKGLVGVLSGGLAFVLGTVEFLMLAAAMAAMFHYVPNTHVRWRHAAAGGLFVAVGFELAKRVLAWYLSTVPSFSNIYGAFATVPILLVWIYLGWVIVLTGAVIAAYAPSVQIRVIRRPDTPGLKFQMSLSLLREFILARARPEHGRTLAELCSALRADPGQVQPLLQLLVDLDWVGRLEEEGAARHVLLIDPELTLARPLITRTLLEPSPVLQGFWERADIDGLSLAALMKSGATRENPAAQSRLRDADLDGSAGQ